MMIKTKIIPYQKLASQAQEQGWVLPHPSPIKRELAKLLNHFRFNHYWRENNERVSKRRID